MLKTLVYLPKIMCNSTSFMVYIVFKYGLFFQTDSTVKAELNNEANDLRYIEIQFNSTIKPLLVRSFNTKSTFTEIENK